MSYTPEELAQADKLGVRLMPGKHGEEQDTCTGWAE